MVLADERHVTKHGSIIANVQSVPQVILWTADETGV